ncbi:MAG: hypothetical protein RQ745_07265 [Longimicrobiales bacterium]|nr:hypothetical protein [Longimicrobiales bacterium]
MGGQRALRLDAHVPAGLAVAFGAGLAQPGGDVSLLLEPSERQVERAERRIDVGLSLNVARPSGVSSEPLGGCRIR